MKIIHFATKNQGKFISVSNDLAKYKIKVIQVPLNLPEPRSDDLQLIAKEKARLAYEKIKKPCIALDAGFYIHSLKGFPKAFVNLVLETIGIEGILKLVGGMPKECEFRHCLAYYDGNSEPVCFESRVEGTLAENIRGEKKDYHLSKLSQIFIPRGAKKTLAEMSAAEYQAWREKRRANSHATRFAEWIAGR